MLTRTGTPRAVRLRPRGFCAIGMRQVAERRLTEVDAMTLLTMAEYARRRGVSRQAISRFVRDWGVARVGPRGLVDAEELDGFYFPRVDAGQPQLRTLDAYGRRWTPPRT